MLNKKIVDSIIAHCGKLTLSTNHGRFLADKSYAFDTMFFACRFINRYRFGNKFDKLEREERSSEYITDLFCLTPGAGQVKNYFTEACALLKFAHIIDDTDKRGVYEICNDTLLEFIASGPENAYIFLYLLTYCVLKNDGILDMYRLFCRAKKTEDKQIIYNEIRQLVEEKDARILDADNYWAKFIPKYIMNVLGYANNEKYVTRTARVTDKNVTVKDVAVNVSGTRANYNLPKKNSYIEDMSVSYIMETLRPYLINKPHRYRDIDPTDTFSIDVADTKLDMFDARDGRGPKHRAVASKYVYNVGGRKSRTVQGEFRQGLLNNTPHVCPVCGFKFEDLLIASHIIPYSKCEDTYDAMNHNNGLLMCPICDKLFESANYITIDHKSGKVIYVPELESTNDFVYLRGHTVDRNYIDCERRHYLKWHNEFYNEKHKIVDEEK